MILVSICCITYNHAPYIRKCLESFLMQKCNFDLEILIYDDSSTDGTSDIVREYHSRYPKLIKPIIQTENQYSKGVRGINAKFNFSRARGKYIALCEGDDYWTDHLKLQKQIDCLESNDDYSLVFSGRLVVSKEGEVLREEMPSKREYDIADVFSGFFPTTQTMVFRSNSFIQFYFEKNPGIYSGDWTIAYLNALVGKFYCLFEVTAAYRETGDGVWTNYSNLDKYQVYEKSLYEFHRRLGWDVSRPRYIYSAFERMAGYIVMGIMKPRFFFRRKYRGHLLREWRRYRVFARYRLLVGGAYKMGQKILKRLAKSIKSLFKFVLN